MSAPTIDTAAISIPNDGKTVRRVLVHGDPGTSCSVSIVAQGSEDVTGLTLPKYVALFPINAWEFDLDAFGQFELELGPIPPRWTSPPLGLHLSPSDTPEAQAIITVLPVNRNGPNH